MSFRIPSTAVVAASILVCGLAAPQASHAAEGHVQNGAGACNAALPAYEGNVRKRPLAIQNEGSASAFVSCSIPARMDSSVGGRSTTSVYVGVINTTTAQVSVSCTLVDGIANVGTPTYIVKTVTIAAGSSSEFLWQASENAGLNFRFSPSVSCALPVGAGLSYTTAYG